MNYRKPFFWITLFIFPIMYFVVSILIAWINIYWFNDYDSKFGRDGMFHLSVAISRIATVFVSLSYMVGLNARWKYISCLSISKLATIIILSVPVTFLLQSLGTLIQIINLLPQSLVKFIGLIIMLTAPALSIIGLLQVNNKIFRRSLLTAD